MGPDPTALRRLERAQHKKILRIHHPTVTTPPRGSPKKTFTPTPCPPTIGWTTPHWAKNEGENVRQVVRQPTLFSPFFAATEPHHPHRALAQKLPPSTWSTDIHRVHDVPRPVRPIAPGSSLRDRLPRSPGPRQALTPPPETHPRPHPSHGSVELAAQRRPVTTPAALRGTSFPVGRQTVTLTPGRPPTPENHQLCTGQLTPGLLIFPPSPPRSPLNQLAGMPPRTRRRD